MMSKSTLLAPIIFVILNVEPGFGRKPKLTAHQRREALKRLDVGEITRDIGDLFKVSHSTISRLKPRTLVA